MVVFFLFCYDLLLYSLDFIILISFMDNQYGDCKLPRIQKNLLMVFIIICSAILLWVSPFSGTYPFFSIIFSFIFLPFYSGKLQKKILFSTSQLAISGYLIALILALLQSLNINLQYIGWNYYITLGGMHLVFWGLILLLKKFSKKDSSSLPTKLLIVVLAIPVSSLLVLTFFIIRSNNNPIMLYSLEIPLLFVFIFINILTAFIYSQFCDLLRRGHEVLLLKQQIYISEQHFEDLISAQERLKSIRHDMKNHLQTLLLLAKQTPFPSHDIQEYIQRLLSNVQSASQIISTGNLGIDAILSLKISQIEEMGISLSTKIVLPPNLRITFEDSIIIFGNILDNAIEACEKIPPKQRWIRLEITYVCRSIFIRISNPFPDIKKPCAEDIYGEHGFGLKNVQTVIKKYNGTMDIENSNSAFNIKLVLYNISDA